MFDRVKNALQIFYKIEILQSFVLKLFCNKIASCMPTTVVQELCRRQFFGNFSKIFQNSFFSKLWATASDFTRNYYFLISFKKYV